MFAITTTLRAFTIEAPTVTDAMEGVCLLLVDGEEIVGCVFDGPCPFLITEIAA